VIGVLMMFGLVTIVQATVTVHGSVILQFAIARTKPSQSAESPSVLWYRLPTAFIPFRLSSRTVPVPHLQQFQTNP
jgi:hypothetical protein